MPLDEHLGGYRRQRRLDQLRFDPSGAVGVDNPFPQSDRPTRPGGADDDERRQTHGHGSIAAHCT